MQTMYRRSFLKGSVFATLAAAQTAVFSADAPKPVEKKTEPVKQPLVTTPPTLQIPAPTSMGVAWGVSVRATGFVDVGSKTDLSDARRVFAGDTGLKSLDDAALSVRITDLTPDSAYYYRTGTLPIDFQGAYKIVPGTPVLSEIHSFRTAGPKSASSFAVINDTHENHTAFALLAAKIDALNPAVTVWNGDLCNFLEQMPKMVQSLLNPGKSRFAVSRPFLFTPGNHDYRGVLARELPRILMTREPTERDSKYWKLNRNYAVRQGDIALIGLDTGEDKPDWRSEWGQLAQFTPYRELQAKWLADVLERPDIQAAPFIVAFCHIPLFDDAPDANPGDLAEGYASWQRQCHDLWSPLFEKHGVQLVVTAHQHKFRFNAPAAGRSWAQVIGGSGCDLKPGRELTVLEGKVADSRLKLTAHDLISKSVLGEYTFKPRD
jgi:3',5'-cyclic AMP phosphodiesterase CpdA